MVEKPDIKAIKARVAAANDMVTALCLPKYSNFARDWIMSIPALPDHDPDLVIGASLHDVSKLITAYERLQAENTALRDALRLVLELFDDDHTGDEADAMQFGEVSNGLVRRIKALLNGAAAMPTTEAAQGQEA